MASSSTRMGSFWDNMILEELKNLDVSNSMGSTAQAINDAISTLSDGLRKGNEATIQDREVLEVIMRKLLEVDEAFYRPLDSPETFKTLKPIAAVAGQGELETYCQEQVNMLKANDLHFKGYTALYYGDCVTSAKYLKEAKELAPKHPLAAIDLEKAEKRLAKAEGELAKAEDGIDKNPNKVQNWLKKANALVTMGELEDALPIFDRAIGLEPENPDALAKKGAALEGLGRFDEAVPIFNKVLEIKPNSQIAKKGLNLAKYFTGGH